MLAQVEGPASLVALERRAIWRCELIRGAEVSNADAPWNRALASTNGSTEVVVVRTELW
jgi:hypothetical protein